ncbi:TIGR00269 family protein [Candidatus Woesearchaeota archaeon]|nr:TIGR00269 family protein [Candidatus Woesearchaeota archaeon]
MCKNCEINSVIILSSGKKLCKTCFNRYFEKKVFKTIRKYRLIEEHDNLVVAVSGGKDSLTLLYLINMIVSKRREVKLQAVLIDEGIKGYRSKTIKDAEVFCNKYSIKLNIFSYKAEFGHTLDELIKKSKINPCAVCGVLRRYMLNKYSKKLKATKLATGHNLDDEAQSILMNQMKHNLEISARLGPITGVIKDKRFIPRIKPLYFMTEKEVMIYSHLKGFTSVFVECPNSYESFRSDIRDSLNQLEAKYPGTKNGIVKTFVESLPYLKQEFKFKSKIQSCSVCSEPCSNEKCKVCNFIEELKIKL